jgi:ribonuclease BN (tRNA processing enzyme)
MHFSPVVGKIAHIANAKNLVLNHFVPADDKSLTDQPMDRRGKQNVFRKSYYWKRFTSVATLS